MFWTFLDNPISSHRVLSTLLWDMGECSRKIKHWPSRGRSWALRRQDVSGDKCGKTKRDDYVLHSSLPPSPFGASLSPGVLRHTPVLSSQPSFCSIALVQLTCLFIICFYILVTWPGSASRFATHKLQDLKLLKIQKCQKFRTLGGERNGEWFTKLDNVLTRLSHHGLPLPFLSLLNLW